jgi:hypothetical protein
LGNYQALLSTLDRSPVRIRPVVIGLPPQTIEYHIFLSVCALFETGKRLLTARSPSYSYSLSIPEDLNLADNDDEATEPSGQSVETLSHTGNVQEPTTGGTTVLLAAPTDAASLLNLTSTAKRRRRFLQEDEHDWDASTAKNLRTVKQAQSPETTILSGRGAKYSTRKEVEKE